MIDDKLAIWRGSDRLRSLLTHGITQVSLLKLLLISPGLEFLDGRHNACDGAIMLRRGLASRGTE